MMKAHDKEKFLATESDEINGLLKMQAWKYQ